MVSNRWVSKGIHLRNCEASGPLDSGCTTQSCTGREGIRQWMAWCWACFLFRASWWMVPEKKLFYSRLENSKEKEAYHQSLEIGDGVKIQYYLPPIFMVQWKNSVFFPIVVCFQTQPFSTSMIMGERAFFFRFFWCVSTKICAQILPLHICWVQTPKDFDQTKHPVVFSCIVVTPVFKRKTDCTVPPPFLSTGFFYSTCFSCFFFTPWNSFALRHFSDPTPHTWRIIPVSK